MLKLICSESDQKTIDDCFKQARETKSLLPIIRVYTTSQNVSTHLNKHLAANTRHTLDLYCTILSCPVFGSNARVYGHIYEHTLSSRAGQIYSSAEDSLSRRRFQR